MQIDAYNFSFRILHVMIEEFNGHFVNAYELIDPLGLKNKQNLINRYLKPLAKIGVLEQSAFVHRMNEWRITSETEESLKSCRHSSTTSSSTSARRSLAQRH